jgi:hypothetical protein
MFVRNEARMSVFEMNSRTFWVSLFFIIIIWNYLFYFIRDSIVVQTENEASKEKRETIWLAAKEIQKDRGYRHSLSVS